MPQQPPEYPAYDPFLGATDEEYSPDKTYTRSTNKHDHASNMQLPLRREHQAMISALVQDETLPAYTSAQAFVRDAIHHRLYYFSQKKNDVVAMQDLSSLARRERMAEKAEIRKAERTFVEEMAAEIRLLQSRGAVAEVSEQIWDMEELANEKSMSPSVEIELRAITTEARNWVDEVTRSVRKR